MSEPAQLSGFKDWLQKADGKANGTANVYTSFLTRCARHYGEVIDDRTLKTDADADQIIQRVSKVVAQRGRWEDGAFNRHDITDNLTPALRAYARFVRMASSYSPTIHHQDLFEAYFKEGGRISKDNYVSSLRRAATILNEDISPALIPNANAVAGVLTRLRQGEYKNEKFGPVGTALRRYAEMVEKKFNGMSTGQSSTATPPTSAKQPYSLPSNTKITPLSTVGRRLLEAIVDYLKTHTVDHLRPETFPTYDQLYHKVVPSAPKVVRFVGRNLRFKGLDDLNDWTTENKSLPKVTGLIVSQAVSPSTEPRPNVSYFSWYRKQPYTDEAWWHEEVRKSLVFDWSPYIGTQQATSPIVVADDLDNDELAPRVIGEISRIVRDTKIVREVKALHDHTCQLCGLRLELSPGIFYSEAHHLKPLGKPHAGTDKIWNVVCVCPNCHVKLDYHAARILPGQLKLKPGHVVSQKSIDHHNANCP